MSTRNDAITLVADKIRDLGTGVDQNTDVLLSDTEIGQEVDAAVSQYSVDKPRVFVTDITGTGSQYYNVAAVDGMAGYEEGFTQIHAIEYPATAVSATKGLPTYLDEDDWRWYRDETITYLYLPNHTPTASQTIRITYTRRHTLSASVDTIPAGDFDAVCDLAAAYCCRRLAANFAKSSDSTIAADSVNYRDSQLRFKQTAEDFLDNYRRKVGVPKDGGPRAALAIREWDIDLTGGWPMLTHHRRVR